MMLTSNKLGATRSLPRSATPFGGSARRVAVKAQAQDGEQEALGRRNLLAALSLISTAAVAQSAKAASDPYEELKSITASRNGSVSLLDKFESSRTAVNSTKADRGIRERLAAEASNAPKSKPASSGGLKLGGSSSPFGSKPSAPKPAGGLFGSGPKPSLPKPVAAAPKPAAPKPAAAPKAAAAGGAGFNAGALGPIAQAVGVLGVVGVGANAVTSFATSNSKKIKKSPKAAPSAAAAAAPAATAAVRRSAGTGVKPAAPKPAAAKPASGTATKKVVKKVPAAAAVSTGTVKGTIKQAFVNEEKPDEPTDFAVAGILGFAAALAGFFLFGLPQPQTVETTVASDPLVELAKESAKSASSSSYSTPLFKSLAESDTAADRKVIAAGKPAPAPAAPAVAAKPAPKVAAPAAPAVVEAPKPAAPSIFASKPAEAPAAKPAEPAKAEEASSSPNNLAIVGGGLALIVAAFAAVGGSGEGSSTEGASSTTTAAGAAPPAPTGGDAAASSTAAAAAESVSAAASTAAAAAPAATGGLQDNAAYNKAVNALFADPDTADELYAITAVPLRNAPALAWALISNATNAETLDGFAYQKLPTAKYQRVRQLLVDMGLQLPETPKAYQTPGVLAPGAATELDPEKLRTVFEALLSDPASRTLMRKLLAGAGMPFDEAAFEQQIKDSTYFNLAIAPILRKMPPQKLAVLSDLQDPAKLKELVSSVSSLASDTTQLDAVTAELSGDVRNTVEKIRETESTTSTTPTSR